MIDPYGPPLISFQDSPVVSVPTEPSIHVTVETGGLDTSHMKIEDFTSQQLSDRIEYAGIDHMEEICSVETVDTGSPSGNLSPPSPPPLHCSLSLSLSLSLTLSLSLSKISRASS